MESTIQFHHIFDELAFFREIDINYKWHNQFKKGSFKVILIFN